MTFTTPTFIIFLIIVYCLYWQLKRQQQNLLILASSLIFYGWWDWRFLFLLFFNAGVDYIVALALVNQEDPRKRKTLLLISLVTNLGVLGFFKYFNFFADSFTVLLTSLGFEAHPSTLQVILPVGISFFTFQALSYTIDVYRRQMVAVHDPVEYFSFIAFFPHMVAGPIQQAKHFLVQFHRDRTFDWDQSVDGARQMLWGFFKKMVVADNLAPIVNAAYSDPSGVSGWQLLWATYCFAVQIYCDFSGYTDIAIGCARLFDLHMTRNFAYPYFSRSIPEFWRRWHISLSNWFRDYLYIPLGGNRVGPMRYYANVLVVFLASGFWHGANWTFVIWGLLHGIYFLLPWPETLQSKKIKGAAGVQAQAPKTGDSAAATTTRPRGDAASPVESAAVRNAPETGANMPGGPGWLPSLKNLFWMLLTFHLVCIAWVFFRADNVTQAFLVLQKIAASIVSLRLERPSGFYAGIWIVLLFTIEWFQRRYSHGMVVGHWARPARRVFYYAVVAIILFWAQLNHVPFIYFQF